MRPYRRPTRAGGPVALSFLASLVGWLVGDGRGVSDSAVHGSPGELGDRAAAGKPGAGRAWRGFRSAWRLGVQETGYVLLAPLGGLTPEVVAGVCRWPSGCVSLLLGTAGAAVPASIRPFQGRADRTRSALRV